MNAPIEMSYPFLCYRLVSCRYRLAPETPYPVPLNDCVAATVYFFRRAADYSVDNQRIVLMGKCNFSRMLPIPHCTGVFLIHRLNTNERIHSIILSLKHTK